MIPLEELDVCKTSIELGELIWGTVARWPSFAKDILGK
jgi:hypothetical protein